MLRTANLKMCKNIVGNFKAKIYEKISYNKRLNDEYDKYIYNAIMEAEEGLANGKKTYTLDEFEEILNKWDEENEE